MTILYTMILLAPTWPGSVPGVMPTINPYAQLERGTGKAGKAESAAIVYLKWSAAEASHTYTKMKSA